MGRIRNKSFTLVELIVAVGVVALVLPAIFNIFFCDYSSTNSTYRISGHEKTGRLNCEKYKIYLAKSGIPNY
ncbi:hypothetical protein COS52_01735 [Candidatus Roizmanbacteria bacterium CG03_land_8_20_14_0_80_39_12]|uniref:Prepilin-type N-terminal cleavage/methylation domain-containing protein n=1 Tax=Candidatus Roizmanbacteria bacterium CG03_land_8_20_14_0_80_39_12 TaxID=1974847 RepID=A0A2M7BT37_9BACT|nr:MAG: hypothetical protein COS52_01735 [Candidatus Roizmanbacteria bacterium CG03_land_8_20_14_0_80_39_12]